MSALTELMVKDWHCGVSPDSIITTEEMIKEFDLKTERAEDIDFEYEFCITATLPGFKHFNVSKYIMIKFTTIFTLKYSKQLGFPHSSFS